MASPVFFAFPGFWTWAHFGRLGPLGPGPGPSRPGPGWPGIIFFYVPVPAGAAVTATGEGVDNKNPSLVALGNEHGSADLMSGTHGRRNSTALHDNSGGPMSENPESIQ